MSFCLSYLIGKQIVRVLEKNIMSMLLKDPIFKIFNDYAKSSSLNYPQVNVTKDEIGYKVLMSVPGLTKDDLKITIKEGVLKISYEKEEKSENTSFVSSFTKSYVLPDDIKEKDIEGKVENGVLELNLPLDKKKPHERFILLN